MMLAEMSAKRLQLLKEVTMLKEIAPLEARVQRVIQMEELTRSEAERRTAGMDRLRTDYVRTFYHADWRDPTHYHLTIDSAVWGERVTADLILSALEHIPDSSERSRHRDALQ